MKKIVARLFACVLTCGFVAGCSTVSCDGCTALERNRQLASKRAEPVALIRPDHAGFESINFGGEGEVSVKDGVLNLDMGTMTGVVYTGDVEKLFGEGLENYEITLDAMRVEGLDIFLGLTFPVGKGGHVSLVLGGWGGTVCGLSSLDGLNASENTTTTYEDYKDNTWHKTRIRVTTEKVECWVNGKQIVDVKRADYKEFDTHGMVTDSKPFGVFTYQTWGAYRAFKVQRLD